MQKMTLEKLAEMMQRGFLEWKESMYKREMRGDIKWIKSRLDFIETRINRIEKRLRVKSGFRLPPE